jgi:hypothetical protein
MAKRLATSSPGMQGPRGPLTVSSLGRVEWGLRKSCPLIDSNRVQGERDDIHQVHTILIIGIILYSFIRFMGGIRPGSPNPPTTPLSGFCRRVQRVPIATGPCSNTAKSQYSTLFLMIITVYYRQKSRYECFRCSTSRIWMIKTSL